MKKTLLTVLIILIAALALIYFLGKKHSSKIDMLIFCENTLKNMLKDPESYNLDDFSIVEFDHLPADANKDLYDDLSSFDEYFEYTKSYPSVIVEYRAKNSFDASTRGTVVCMFDATKNKDGIINNYIKPVSVRSGNTVIDRSSDDADKIYAWSKYSDSSFSVKNRKLSPLFGFYYSLMKKTGF